MEQEDLKYKRLRERMVKEHIESRGINDPRVLAAFLKVKRHFLSVKH
jgi:protein-L-isoaspartate(D-aspartate) O-methyltransferase